MQAISQRHAVIAVGMGLALIAGLVLAFALLFRGGPPVSETSTSSGLVVETGHSDDLRLDPDHPLRCFVGGQSIGELPLRECARRNGVATGALDVGLDPSGALSAASGPTSQVTPLPPQTDTRSDAVAPPDVAAVETAARPAPVAQGAACWRYGDGGWSRLPDAVSLPACVQSLFSGQCEPAGEVAYGRWGARTLRLVGSTVQVSDNNRNFRFLVGQGPGCSLPSP